MAQNYKIRNMLKNLPFYSNKINKIKKRSKNLLMLECYLNYHSFLKKAKKLTNYQLSKELPFFPKNLKDLKD